MNEKIKAELSQSYYQQLFQTMVSDLWRGMSATFMVKMRIRPDTA